ncbi:MAG: hypothetical protein ABW034_12790 [Steroidobacteraceae bacterium]
MPRSSRVSAVRVEPLGGRGVYVDYELAPFWLVMARYLSPFWLFRDASRGDWLTRAAAYRHNRSMRTYLPSYMGKWAFQAALALCLTFVFDSLAMPERPRFGVYVLFAAGSGIAFACCLCMLFIMAYAYLYLARHDYR